MDSQKAEKTPLGKTAGKWQVFPGPVIKINPRCPSSSPTSPPPTPFVEEIRGGTTLSGRMIK